MKNQLVIHELTIAIAINNYDLTLCLPRFLQSSGIVPSDWSLRSEPIVNNQIVQTIYSNGVNIIGQPNRCLFAENLENKTPSNSEVSPIASNYIKILPHLDYQAIGINLRGYFKLGTNQEDASKDFFNKLLVPGSWQEQGTKPMEAELKLNYIFDDKVLTLNINKGFLRQPDTEAMPIILFSGNFAYNLSPEALETRVERGRSIIDNWHKDLELFQDVVSSFPEIKMEETAATKNLALV